MQLSKNFSLAELTYSQSAVRKGIDNTAPYDAVENLKLLAENVLQPIRDFLGAPIKITSGYRSQSLNQAVGGSKTSQHNKGQAADFVVQGMAPTQVCLLIIASGVEFDQLIDEGTWVHISYNKENNRKQVLTAKFDAKGKATYTAGLDID